VKLLADMGVSQTVVKSLREMGYDISQTIIELEQNRDD